MAAPAVDLVQSF